MTLRTKLALTEKVLKAKFACISTVFQTERLLLLFQALYRFAGLKTVMISCCARQYYKSLGNASENCLKIAKKFKAGGVIQNIKIILFLFPLQSSFRFVIRLIFAFCSWSHTSNFILFAKSCHYSHIGVLPSEFVPCKN